MIFTKYKNAKHIKYSLGYAVNSCGNIISLPRTIQLVNKTTKKVRGLLCNRCNTLLGLIDDNPEFMENITNYLNK